MPDGAARRHPARHVLVARRRARPRRISRACSCSAAARSCAKCSRRADLLAERLERRKRRVERDELQRACSATASRARAENLLHPDGEAAASRTSSSASPDAPGPAIAATDYMRTFAEQIRPYIVDRRYVTLGTDGYGRSDFRRKLREFFEVDRFFVDACRAARARRKTARSSRASSSKAIEKYDIDPNKPNPMTV